MIRRILGAAILAGVIAGAFGIDRGILTQLSLSSKASLEQRLVDRFHPSQKQPTAPNDAMMAGNDQMMAGNDAMMAGDDAMMAANPHKAGAGDAMTGPVGSSSALGTALAKVSGFEKDEANVRKAVKELGIAYPVAMDNEFRVCRNFNNEYWPADYFIDASGHIRHHEFGEGNYDDSEKWIRTLLEEANHQPLPDSTANIASAGTEAPPDSDDVTSPETYVGYGRAQNLASPGGLEKDRANLYQTPSELLLNQWAFTGNWKDTGQIATALAPSTSVVYRFHARDLHFVLGPSKDGKPYASASLWTESRQAQIMEWTQTRTAMEP
jgi:hypothetical protein